MPKVKLTSHLYRYFPQLEKDEIWVSGQSVADVIASVEKLAPGFCHYILDDTGQVRRHVFISIQDSLLIDRKTQSDKVTQDETVYIFQALTGG